MALNSVESNRTPLIGSNYENSLHQSIQRLLAENRKKSPNFASFNQIFYEFMQASVDPPIESIWVYSALTFRSRNASNDDPLAQLSNVKDLFQLVSACSAPCGSSKSIALLAPVVLEMYKLAVGCFGRDMASKSEKKVMRGVKALLDVVLGYISVCCCNNSSEESSNLVEHFGDLVSVWTSGNDGVESFLPLISVDISKGLGGEDCNVGHLAGIVIAEAFLLKLCLSFRDGVSGTELEKDLRTWAVGSLTGFKNFYVLEIISRMLLETAMPVTSLMGSEDEVLLRKVLFDAVILVEYSFLNPERVTHLSAERLKSFAIARLVVTYEAIELFREVGDRERAISYQNAFFSSPLPYQIIKWVSSQIGMEAEPNRSHTSSPKLLLKWLLNIEGQGIRIFDDSISKCRAKLVLDLSRAECEQPTSKILGEEDSKMDFYIDKKGDDEDGDNEDKVTTESMNAAFVAAAHTMEMTENEGRKRKEGKSDEKKKRIKFLKYNLADSSDLTRERSSPVREDGSSSESEVENPQSDEDTET